jgi:O-antigen/teichoic acid export membrane protein
MYNIVTVLIALTLSIGGGIYWGLNGWAIGRFIGELLSAIIVIIPIRKLFLYIWDKNSIINLVSFGGLAVIALLLDRLVQMGDVIILVRNGSQAHVIGTYGLATSLFTALTLPIGATMMAAYPLLAQQGSILATWKLARKLFWRIAILSIIIAFFAYFSGPWLIEMIWGEPYADSVQYYQALLFLFVVNSLLTVLGTYSFSIGKPAYSVTANLTGFIVFLVFSSIVVNYFQVLGIIILLSIVSLLRMVVFIILIGSSLKRQTNP